MKDKKRIGVVSVFILLFIFTVVSLRAQNIKYRALEKEYVEVVTELMDVKIENVNLKKEIEESLKQ